MFFLFLHLPILLSFIIFRLIYIRLLHVPLYDSRLFNILSKVVNNFFHFTIFSSSSRNCFYNFLECFHFQKCFNFSLYQTCLVCSIPYFPKFLLIIWFLSMKLYFLPSFYIQIFCLPSLLFVNILQLLYLLAWRDTCKKILTSSWCFLYDYFMKYKIPR